MSDKHYDLFISYASKDRPWVSEFVAALQKEGLHPWSDAEIAPGEKWEEAIQQALRESNALVMVLSPDSTQSPWTFFELGAAIAGKKKIIPVLVKDLEWSRIPAILRQFQCLNEPSASAAGKRVAEVLSRYKNQQTPIGEMA